ncbi:MAG: sigma D regulator [Candidatus Thiodiazotropha sp. (ex Dulcina madagascariensis)]|nr:sigma D regulator [Candidatus Thiodiazotropha sp. (ex Epidulcina cf. delphinae)]MCU7922056.1 sigma D regulator [Candidatus Thiodiazotropha sp. (ex Dulcina madagascariensis)]MCU7926496.1 sigma D regulator [Candidatus Thiodiazotropha sp. (ex Dulcina madagascariensis)]MCU7937219.1 sigma D regulator [Candidatus Thiodiazotropha sp. (ex Dulcina madagascariensis)]
MNSQEGCVEERRTVTQDLIDKLLSERQEMLVLFCEVAGLEPYHRSASLDQQLQTFCQVLIDYTAFGHFEVFGRISDGNERRSGVIRIAENIYPDFVKVSEAAVAFNDRYDLSDHQLELNHLAQDLSQLGEELAVRIELEDQLLSAMLDR